MNMIDLYITGKDGLPRVVYFETVRKALSYARRAMKRSVESVRKLTWIGRDNSLHYTPLSDWYDAIAVLKVL